MKWGALQGVSVDKYPFLRGLDPKWPEKLWITPDLEGWDAVMVVFDEMKLIMLLQVLISAGLPLLVGILSTKLTNGLKKSLLLLGLNLLAGQLVELVAALQHKVEYDVVAGLISSLMTFLFGVGLHYGLFKPSGLTSVLLSIGRTANPATVAAVEAMAPVLTTAGPVEKPLLNQQLNAQEQAPVEVTGDGTLAVASVPQTVPVVDGPKHLAEGK